MNRNSRKCEVCGKHHRNGVFYRIVVSRVSVTGTKGSYKRTEKVVESWQFCARHMMALRHMLEVITHRREKR